MTWFLIVQVRVDGEVIPEFARAEAMTGSRPRPATISHRPVAIAYMSAALLRPAERGEIDPDEPIAKYVPGFPAAETATPRMLISMTAGYPDCVANQGFALRLDR